MRFGAEETQLNEKPVSLVTGASSGIGDGIARRFAAGGYRIVAVARRKERLDDSPEVSREADIVVLAADVTTTDAPEQAVGLAMKSFGRLDCLVNIAGSGNRRRCTRPTMPRSTR